VTVAPVLQQCNCGRASETPACVHCHVFAAFCDTGLNFCSDRMHRTCCAKNSFDGNCQPLATPLLFHWGDLESANAVCDRTYSPRIPLTRTVCHLRYSSRRALWIAGGLSNFKRLQGEALPDACTVAQGLNKWPCILYLLGRNADGELWSLFPHAV
jgi:hypothetical protein